MSQKANLKNSGYLRVKNIDKSFGSFRALKNVSFQADRGELISVLGPSGCGKTTLLRVVAGLEKQDSGEVFVGDRDLSNYPISKRNVGIVFQSYALFPNLTARQNIAYGLKTRKLKKSEIDRKVDALLQLTGLKGLGRRYPAQLSGGQQQRVALSRAIAVSPDILLLDEPLSALDAKVRVMLRLEIRQLQQRLGVTTIMVTHDQEEALTMADRILVMDQGKLVQEGTPHEIYEHPATPFVASFIGSMNFIGNAVKQDQGVYKVGEHILHVSGENGSAQIKEQSGAILAIRPENVMILPNEEGRANVIKAQVEAIEYRGAMFRVGLKLPLGGDTKVLIESDMPSEKISRLNISENMVIPVHFPTDRLRVYQA
ncbi:MAG: putative 2-aminoethylphosphonate ABC transporter ATP-binding protein [Desulfamplus sp.]|nr:putative 2-aminoethylphosphonate ABC transporter ATP-binding protein [Desulfamplus sp.]